MPAGVYQKQQRSHPELTAEVYRRLPDIVAGAAVIIRQGAIRLIYIANRETDGANRWWKALVRQDKGQPYPAILSFQPADDRELARESRKGEIVVDRR